MTEWIMEGVHNSDLISTVSSKVQVQHKLIRNYSDELDYRKLQKKCSFQTGQLLAVLNSYNHQLLFATENA